MIVSGPTPAAKLADLMSPVAWANPLESRVATTGLGALAGVAESVTVPLASVVAAGIAAKGLVELTGK